MSDIEDRVTIKNMGGTFQSEFLDGKQVEPGKVEPGRATAMRAACIAGLKKGLQDGREEAQQPQQEECYRRGHPIPDGEDDPRPEPETVDNKIYPTDGYDEVYVPSRESRVSCVHATEHNTCLGYVVEGLEDLPNDQLPQMPVVWVYTSGGGLPPYLFHPPAPVSRDVYERTRAHAMRFKVEANNES